MKNTVKLLSMLVAAGAMLFASCEPVPEEIPSGTPKYTITVNANNDAYGTVTGGGEYDSAATATLTATPNEGYKFVNWSDGNENNPRLVTVVANASYTANFIEITGVNVTFGDVSWTAQYNNVLLYSNAYMIASAQNSDPTTVPQLRLEHVFSGAPVAGTYTGSANYDPSTGANTGNPFITYFDNTEEMLQLIYQDQATGQRDTVLTGGWWDKDVTVNVTSLDADNMIISLVANATMGHAYELLDGTAWNNISTRNLTLNVINQSMTTGAKAFMKSHGIAKLVRK